MALVRRRYYIWLLKAYLKRWSKAVIVSVLVGILVFFALLSAFSLYLRPVLEKQVEKIGLWGTFSSDSLPPEVLELVSYGLTHLEKNAGISPKASIKWDVEDNGKRYIFHIKRNQYFHNNQELTASNIPIEFKDVKKNTLSKYEVEYILKEPYSPFLVSMSKPILLTGYSGLGNYKVKQIETNADFLKSVTLVDINDAKNRKVYYFYPTPEALITAFMLGEVDSAKGLPKLSNENHDISSWKNVNIKKVTNYNKLVTIFYNYKDPTLSSLKLRQALNYALPSTFESGERADSPIPPHSIYYSKAPTTGIYDMELASQLLSETQLKKEDLKFTISTTAEFENVASDVQKTWKKLGVTTEIKTVNDISEDFQILIHSFKIPKDPDQYTLWHSAQKNNIARYKNDRIDKLLEDGRVTTDPETRIKIYADFQKYLLNDTPASFLYFPFEYTIDRK